MPAPRGPLSHYVSVNQGVYLTALNQLGGLRQDFFDPLGHKRSGVVLFEGSHEHT